MVWDADAVSKLGKGGFGVQLEFGFIGKIYMEHPVKQTQVAAVSTEEQANHNSKSGFTDVGAGHTIQGRRVYIIFARVGD